MFTFYARDNGFICFDANKHAVASVDCGRIEYSDDGGRLKVPVKNVDAWKYEEWEIHFTSHKLSPAELTQFLAQLPKQWAPPKPGDPQF